MAGGRWQVARGSVPSLFLASFSSSIDNRATGEYRGRRLGVILSQRPLTMRSSSRSIASSVVEQETNATGRGGLFQLLLNG